MDKQRIVFVLILLLVVGVIEWIGIYGDEVESIAHEMAHDHTASEDQEMQQELEYLIEMIDQHPQSAKLYAERANIFMLMDKPVQALSDIEAAVDLEPDNPQYLTNRALAYRHFERHDHALADLNKAIALEPGLLAAYFNRGVLLFNMEEFERAISDFTFCIQSAPEMEQAYFNRAFTYEQMGDLDKAKADLMIFLEISKNEEARAMVDGKLREWGQPESESR